MMKFCLGSQVLWNWFPYIWNETEERGSLSLKKNNGSKLL